MEILSVFQGFCRLNVDRNRADAAEAGTACAPSRRQRCAAPLEDARFSCARFPSFCSHFSLRSSQWQQPFTAQLTYAECLRPAGVSHPHAPRLSSRRSLGRSDIYYFISSDSSSTDLGYLRWFLSPRERGWGKKGTPALKSAPAAGACHRAPSHPSPSSPLSVDAQVRFTIRTPTFVEPRRKQFEDANHGYFVDRTCQTCGVEQK